MKLISDISYGTAHESQKLDLHLPESSEFYAVVFIHGGGLEAGDKANDKGHFEYLVANGYAVVAPNYRMYPDARYPEYIEDSAAAVAWAFENLNKYGKCKGIFVGGSSAGGYLSMMLCFDKRWLAPYGIKPTDITGWLHVAGQPTCHFKYLEAERNVNRNRVIIDETAPLYHIGTDSEYSPMLFIVSDNDMKNRYEQTMLMMSALKTYNYENFDLKIMSGKHCAYCSNRDENGILILAKLILDFIKGQ